MEEDSPAQDGPAINRNDSLESIDSLVDGHYTKSLKDSLDSLSQPQDQAKVEPQISGEIDQSYQQDKEAETVSNICEDDVMNEIGSEWSIGDRSSIFSTELRGDIKTEPDCSLQDDVTAPISNCGQLHVTFQYSLAEKIIAISNIEGEDLPEENRGGSGMMQVRLLVLPERQKRFKTKPRKVKSLIFTEIFKLKNVPPEQLQGLGFRFRVYSTNKVSPDRLVGECCITTTGMNLTGGVQQHLVVQLEPRININKRDLKLEAGNDGGTGSAAALAYGGDLPEVFLSLSYNEVNGRLQVGVEKAAHLHNRAVSKPPEMASSKTSIRKAQPNPAYKESFYFQVSSHQLSEVSLLVNVYRHLAFKNKLLGWISMGASSSGEDEEQHWDEMRKNLGQTVFKWHTLTEA